MLEGTAAARFELVTAGHHFLLAALPFRNPQSRRALREFIEAATTFPLSSPDREAVLLRLLAVLEPHSGGRLPSLVDRYFLLRTELPDQLSRFQRCVEDVIRYLGLGHPQVQKAIAIILERFSDANLHQADVADAVEMTSSGLCAAFVAHTGCTFTEYLRDVRLERGAALLTGTTRSIKEIWAAVGYSDGATFDHDFKPRFRITPTAYRAAGIRTGASGVLGNHGSANPRAAATGPQDRRRVLVVDDDLGTRETLGRALRHEGYTVECAASGSEALTAMTKICPTAIVLDRHLPDVDGFAWLRAVRASHPAAQLPVLVFSADLDVEDRADEASALGAAVMSKLADLEEVQRVLHSLCAMHS